MRATKKLNYQERLEQTKQYLVNEMLPGYPNASFVELERKLMDNGFHEEVENKGERVLTPKGRPHLVIWITDNKLLLAAFIELDEEKKVHGLPTSPIIYFIDGKMPSIPVAERKHYKDKYIPKTNEQYWCPTIVNLGTYKEIKK